MWDFFCIMLILKASIFHQASTLELGQELTVGCERLWGARWLAVWP